MQGQAVTAASTHEGCEPEDSGACCCIGPLAGAWRIGMAPEPLNRKERGAWKKQESRMAWKLGSVAMLQAAVRHAHFPT